MSKKYLGIICLIYSGIFGYVFLFDKIKFFLAPQMQVYVKLSIFPMLFIGLVILFSNQINYKFKISDLVLLLPLMFLLFAGDGRLTTSFASSRVTNFNRNSKLEIKKNKTKKVVTTLEKEKNEEYNNFDNPYFEVIDQNYNELSDYITFAPKADKFQNKTIKVRGLVLEKDDYLPEGYFALGKFVISCCAADASFAGFAIKYDNNNIKVGEWYEIDGILKKGQDKMGYDIMYIEVINSKNIKASSEEQFVYPCYVYGDNYCEDLLKYDLDY